jgi:copper chaperone CopZ
MKKLTVLFLMFAMSSGFAGDLSAQKKGREVVCFKSDMDCGECEQALYDHLRFEKGIKDLKVDHASNTIFIEYKTKKNSDEGFAQAIKKKGYKAEKISKDEYEKIVARVEEEGHNHNHEAHRERE